ncbi:MAG: hypothetical protein HQ548_08250 [Chloroflexi bacterium]|nr:hypothetical protein [Chloroflexota bacterium]
MSRFDMGKDSQLTLCIFPHLREFVVVDARGDLPERPRISTFEIDEVLERGFYDGVESDFASLLRRSQNPFLSLMSIPQEVEGVVRTHVLRAILSKVNSDLPGEPAESSGSVAVLFFTGPLLGMGEDELSRAAKELFGDALPAELVETCIEQMCLLARREREAETALSRTDLPSLIKGESDRYVTLWESQERN